ncbi:hypothetical protein GCM10011490_10540 [Pseudoclavibacter endophyticus]|uniref:Uncharacterized protein n=1 Tax=Pseudoclavibacter endophyticus TaxID=1778590 RepID=A0A6H9WN47_9MICO|nr:hypothetical protein [Pseudoclavibacter endophyticus]KAB1649508.1 hypothetical protein F8O04_04415 [Pseudoclavibacter endophyticus]GGA62055.1 hypothetical protein GCM10011490_10540 [Pseudoclavibacter endophyticus]
MNHRLVAPVERVAAAPGTAWPVPAVIVDAAGGPIGFVPPGARDCGAFDRGALDGPIDIRQLRTGAVTAVCEFQRVAVGGEGAGFDRLGLEAEVALDGRDDWRTITRLLLTIAAEMRAADASGRGGERHVGERLGDDPDDASSADPIDDGLQRALADAFESFVRQALRRADAGRARDESLMAAVSPHAPSADAPLPIGGGFSVHAMRVTRATWSERPGWEDAAAGGPASAAELDAERATDTASVPDDVADAPLGEYLGSNATLADVWSRETKGDRIAAIGGVVRDGSATVLVLHPDPTRAALAYSSTLVNALAAELRTPKPRIIVLAEAATLRELLTMWLAEQAPPPGTETAIVVDARQSRVVLELTGDGAAEFVQRVAEEDRTDLAALGSVLPWRIVLRATDDDGLIEADSAATALRSGNDESQAGAVEAHGPATEAAPPSPAAPATNHVMGASDLSWPGPPDDEGHVWPGTRDDDERGGAS